MLALNQCSCHLVIIGDNFALWKLHSYALESRKAELKVRAMGFRKSRLLNDGIPPKLAHQLRMISSTSDSAQYCVGSVEVRVILEWLEDYTKSLSFFCDRVDYYAPTNGHPNGVDTIVRYTDHSTTRDFLSIFDPVGRIEWLQEK